jgi:glycerol kinase
MPPILALDQGTTGSTAIVFEQDGTVLGRGYREIPQHFPAPGWVEHDAEDLVQCSLEAMREAMAQAAAQGAVPVALGIANQRESVLLWDRTTRNAVTPVIVWQDRRTAERCRALAADQPIARMLRERTGLLPDPYFSAMKLEWLLRDPGLRRRAERGDLCAGTVDTWLLARFTGGTVFATDPTNASRTMLFDHMGAVWHDDLLALFGIPRALLPRILPSAGSFGTLDPKWLGVALPITGVAGDQQAALFGAGGVQPGFAKTTYGTGAFTMMYAGTARPAVPPGVLLTAAVDAAGRRAYALEGSVLVAGAAVQWLRDGLGLVAHAAETEALARSVADTGGVTFVPAFAGLGTPYWESEARGTITGLTRGTTRAHLVRATLEAIGCSVADLLLAMKDIAPLAHLRVDGGMAQNDFLLQYQADLLGLPVERPAMVEATAWGAACLAGLGAGLWPAPDAGESPYVLTRFEPVLDDAERTRRMQAWRRAVGAAIAWARQRA